MFMKQLLLIVGIIFLTGCTSGDISDLQAFVAQIKATYKGKVEPIPEYKNLPPYEYAAFDIRDPFNPVVDIEVISSTYSGPKPDENRAREPLEEFSLDSLRMVGTLAQNENDWVLIKDPDGLLHRITTGNYLGRNYGKVISVNDEIVSLVELVPDSKGGWMERSASIALSE